MMCIDFRHLEVIVKELEAAKVDFLHFDIMDGNFVPNFTFGPDFMHAVRSLTNIPFDIHLMIQNPENHLDIFDIKPGDQVFIHQESTIHLQKVLHRIKEMGARVGVALNPATSIHNLENILDDIDVVLVMTVNPGFASQKLIPSTIKKIINLKNYLVENGYEAIEIEVDGNVSFENAKIMKDAGANVFVAGTSSIFTEDKDIKNQTDRLRSIING